MTNEEVLKQVSFPVTKRQVYFRDLDAGFVEVHNRMAVVRTDTNQALSVVSKDYRLVPYREVVEPLLEQIDKTGGKLVSRDFGRRSSPVRVEGHGRRVWIEAKFGHTYKIGADEIQPRIVYGNSYDTSSAVRMICGFFQIKCTNAGALMMPGKVKGLDGGAFYAQHSGRYELELGQIGESLQGFLGRFDEHAAKLAVLADAQLKPEKGMEIAMKYLGERALAKKPLVQQDHHTAWALYSRITNHLTIDFKGGQQPAESRAASALRDILQEIDGNQ